MNLAFKTVYIHFPAICALFERDKYTTYAIRHALFLPLTFCSISKRR